MRGITLVQRASLCEGRCTVMTDDDVNVSSDEADVETFHGMRPSFIVQMSDEEHEEFMRIV